ncbi:MAG: sulfatase [Candidatus Fervidibacter sp.]|uniref:sulfatase n=1 Tax=Candidatus Fervidibacter sp. TaxID=3100871 RepID=UPI004049D779
MIDRRTLLRQMVGSTLLPLTSFLHGSPRRLNVLFIAVDDLNRRLGCCGDPYAKTPNIDRLAQRGVVFRRAYCQYPLCNPSRTSLLSGLYPTTTRVLDNSTPPRTHVGDIAFLPQHFREHGYFTVRVGKIFHGGMDDPASWDISEDARRPKEKTRQKDKQFEEGGGWMLPQTQPVGRLVWQMTKNEDEEEVDGASARRAVQILEGHMKQRKGQPFFLAVGFHKPHLPWVAPRKYFEMHDPSKLPLPSTPPDDLSDIPPIALTLRPEEREMSEEQKRLAIRAYYACVSFVDAQIGVLLKALDKFELWDSTVVVLFGDHGFHLGEHGGHWCKMTLFEESAGAPLIVAAPNVKGTGKPCFKTVEFVDIYPTLCELCDLPMPKHKLEGRSLVPLLDEPERKWDKPAFTVVQRKKGLLGISVRTERWRYTEWDEGRAGTELYDHNEDPNEWHNFATDPKLADVVKEMKALLRRLPHLRP